MALEKLMTLSLLVFVLTNISSMGLSLTVSQIVDSLSGARLMLTTLFINFIIAPLLALALVTITSVTEPLAIGLLIMSTAAGAPILPKLVQIAKGRMAASVGVMVLLMVITVFYLPLALPLFLGNIKVNSVQIVKSLVIYMLMPLVFGLLLRAQYETIAEKLRPILTQISNFALFVLILLGFVLHNEYMLALVTSGGVLAVLLFVGGLFLIGYTLSGNDTRIRSVTGLAAGHRNISAALVVAGENFGPEVTTYVLVAGFINLIILMTVAALLGKRNMTTDAMT